MLIDLKTAKGAVALEEAARRIGEAARLLDQAYVCLPAEWQAKLSAAPAVSYVDLALSNRLHSMAREMFKQEGI